MLELERGTRRIEGNLSSGSLVPLEQMIDHINYVWRRAAVEEFIHLPIITYEPLGLHRTHDLRTTRTGAHLWPTRPNLCHTNNLSGARPECADCLQGITRQVASRPSTKAKGCQWFKAIIMSPRAHAVCVIRHKEYEMTERSRRSWTNTTLPSKMLGFTIVR